MVDDAAGDYLTVNEAADHAGVSRHKIARLIRSGVLAVYESDLDRRRRYVRRSDLAALRSTFRAARGPVLTDPDRPPVPITRLRAAEQIRLQSGPGSEGLPGFVVAEDGPNLWFFDRERGEWRQEREDEAQ